MRIDPFRRLLVLALLLASCTPSRTGPAPADPERAIRETLAEYVRAVNGTDWDRASRVWAPDVLGWNSGNLRETDGLTRSQRNCCSPYPDLSCIHGGIGHRTGCGR